MRWLSLCTSSETARNAGAVFILLSCALLIGLLGIDSSGPLWDDGPRYTNAAAMMRDWYLSKKLFAPIEFAKADYARFPGFNIPFHPPAYPALMALFYLVVGESYFTSRLFVALMSGLAAIALHGILRIDGRSRYIALAAALLMLTTPEFMKWSRCTMSEIPSIAIMLLASYYWLCWCRYGTTWRCWLAFGLALIAFFSRVTACAILPAWIVYLALAFGWRRCLNRHVILASVAYLAICMAWFAFVREYARYEVVANGKSAAGSLVAIESFLTFIPCLRPMLLWGTTWMALIGAAALVPESRQTKSRESVTLFFLLWLASFVAFKMVVPTSTELRHAFGMVPALAGMAAGVATVRGLPKLLVSAAFAVAIAANLRLAQDIPHGLVGYEVVATEVSRLPKAGNILMATVEDQDFIFRYRSKVNNDDRQLLRADRTLSVRLSRYANVAATPVATTCAEFDEVIAKGRVRYIVTCSSAENKGDPRTREIILAQSCLTKDHTHYRLIGEWSLSREYTTNHIDKFDIHLWECQGSLREGPSELPIIIPTAGLNYIPSQLQGSNLQKSP